MDRNHLADGMFLHENKRESKLVPGRWMLRHKFYPVFGQFSLERYYYNLKCYIIQFKIEKRYI